MASDRLPVRRALLSVSDKTGVLELARALAAMQVELLSTGGTAKALRDAGIAVRDVSEVTGFPEIMDGRVKTLHPSIHGGLLGRSGIDDAVMAEHGIRPIDLLVVNLYPFAATVAKPDCSYDDAIENIDIGGPAMLRAAAKNHARVSVVVDPAQYAGLLEAPIEFPVRRFRFVDKTKKDRQNHFMLLNGFCQFGRDAGRRGPQFSMSYFFAKFIRNQFNRLRWRFRSADAIGDSLQEISAECDAVAKAAFFVKDPVGPRGVVRPKGLPAQKAPLVRLAIGTPAFLPRTTFLLGEGQRFTNELFHWNPLMYLRTSAGTGNGAPS